jgi:hypothetical protein
MSGKESRIGQKKEAPSVSTEEHEPVNQSDSK